MVVEDEFVIAMDLQHMLEDKGYQVLGPHVSVSEALCDLADERQMPDAAVLDVQLDGEDVMLLAEQLRLRNVPIVFHSGHAKPEDLEQRFPGSFFCAKPCSAERLTQTIAQATDD
ncbi:MAG: response regulator [Sphingomonas sp.]|nr:response regulator [Sphingomonas sp.]